MKHNLKPTCTPTTFSYGKDLTRHDNEAGSFYWCVRNGHTPGIYLDCAEGGKQISGFSDGDWKSFRKHEEPLAYWKEYCLEKHNHAAPKYQVKGIQGFFKTFEAAVEAAAELYVRGVSEM
ncbi:hypothetical protein B0H19DRAFT_1123348 [Mycena capillaripes]|nr:hypothetical protein B0H19DRAFT_1123348 [Mycena capillaripes]